MDKIDFAKKEPTLCKIQLFFKVLLPQDRIDRLYKIGSILAKSVLAIQSLRNFALESLKKNVFLRKDISNFRQPESKSNTLFDCLTY